MWIRPYVCSLIAAAACLFPAGALAGTLATATISAPPGDVAAGSTVQVKCWAEGSPGFGSATTALRIDVTTTGGTADPATLLGTVTLPCSFDATQTCSVIQGYTAWTTPSTPGAYTVTCTGWFQALFGGPQSKSASASLVTVASSALPPVVGAVEGPALVLVGEAGEFGVTATDPNDAPLPLTYAWSATGGTITPDPANPAAASWQAPDAPGSFEIIATVSNGVTASASRKIVSTVLGTYQAGLPIAVHKPRRLCADEAGALYVVDGLQADTGGITLVTKLGETRGFAALPEPALAIAYGDGQLWVTTTAGNLYRLDAATGQNVQRIALETGALKRPAGIAYDAVSQALWIADAETASVRIVRPDGATVAVLASAGGAPFARPIDVAIDAASARAYVLVSDAKLSLEAGDPAVLGRFLHVFDLSGQYLSSQLPAGDGTGELTRAGGLAISATGDVYVSDVFQGHVLVVSPSGSTLGSIGTFGADEGQLLNPTGLAVMANGDVAVANGSLGRIDRFGKGTPLPVCEGDQDCDGLPDGWELAHGLNPTWAGDSLLDYDGDGLSNTEEFALGTDPRNVDTDGDGFSDGDEILAGLDPTDPRDHRPIVHATGPGEALPGLVRLSATVSGIGECGVRWTQAGGPRVTLVAPEALTPAFVARTAAAYAFDAVAVCTAGESEPARVDVAVLNVAPRADAGRILVVQKGEPFTLEAGWSSDANGDVLAYTWDQVLGSALTGTFTGGVLTLKTKETGLYGFQVTATDPANAAGIAEVPVVVTAEVAPTAIARAVPAEAEVGATVLLDASASFTIGKDDVYYAWRQVAGPGAVLEGAAGPIASFVPSAAGRHVFEATISEGRLRSPPARVDVFVAESGRPLPLLEASGPSAPVVAGTPASLEATSATSGIAYAWRQVSGPASGMTGADAAVATVVPFQPGFYVFEVSATDGAAEGRPVRVGFEARAGDVAIPQAHVAVLSDAPVAGKPVFLDGSASTGALRFRWTQVAGPWVPVAVDGATASFVPPVAGVYAFELEVDDGTARSAPARVEVVVSD